MKMRKKVLIIIGVLVILSLGGVLIWGKFSSKLFTGADVKQTTESDYPIKVKLTKGLADKVKSQMKPSATRTLPSGIDQDSQNKIDSLTKQELDKTIAEDKSQTRAPGDEEKQKFLDAVVVFTDENTRPILPDLENIKSTKSSFLPTAFAETRTTIPSTNKIAFVISSDFNVTEKQAIQQSIDTYYSHIQNIYGPPLFNITVTIRKQSPDSWTCGLYFPSTNIIQISYVNDKNCLLHEMVHAWRDDLVASPSQFEEGSATFVADKILSFEPIDGSYDFRNRSFLAQSVISQPQSGYSYGFSAKAFSKLWIEDNSFFKNFNTKIYQGFSAKNALLGSISTVEGQSINNWFTKQYIFNPSTRQGRAFIPENLDFRLVDLSSSSPMAPLNNKTISYKLSDMSGNVLGENTCETLYGFVEFYKKGPCSAGFPVGDFEGVSKLVLTDIETSMEDVFYLPIKITAHEIVSGDYNPVNGIYIVLPQLDSNLLSKLSAFAFQITDIRDQSKISLSLIPGGARMSSDLFKNESSYRLEYYSAINPIPRILAVKNKSEGNEVVIIDSLFITGQVKLSSGRTTNPQAGVKVTIQKQGSTAILQETITDANGNYALNVSNGIYIIKATYSAGSISNKLHPFRQYAVTKTITVTNTNLTTDLTLVQI